MFLTQGADKMIVIISFLILFASLVAMVSGVWVVVGLVTELTHPSNESEAYSRSGAGLDASSQKKQNSSELL